MYEHILPSFFFFLLDVIRQCHVNRCSLVREEREKKKKNEENISCKTDEKESNIDRGGGEEQEKKSVQIYLKFAKRKKETHTLDSVR